MKYNTDKLHACERHHNWKFNPSISSNAYQEIFKREISASATKKGQGFILMDRHVSAFQCSSTNGFFLYDAYGTGSLLKYPNEETFFQKLRDHIIDNINPTEGAKVTVSLYE